MGSFFCKNEDNTSEMVEDPEVTKNVRLLVLHDRAQPPDMKKFCHALNAHPPPSSIKVENRNVWIINTLTPMNKESINQWVKEWLNKGRIVLVCLLCNCNTEFLPNRNEVIKFCFQKPPVQGLKRIEVDFDQTTRQQILEKLGWLGALIQGGGL